MTGRSNLLEVFGLLLLSLFAIGCILSRDKRSHTMSIDEKEWVQDALDACKKAREQKMALLIVHRDQSEFAMTNVESTDSSIADALSNAIKEEQ